MTETNTRQRRPAGNVNRIHYVERSYPGADANTAQLVSKLRHRGVTDPRAAVRLTSSALIEDAYRGVPERQQPRTFDNNYSPYSNVNAEAAREMMERQEEMRRRATEKRQAEMRRRVAEAKAAAETANVRPQRPMPKSTSKSPAVRRTAPPPAVRRHEEGQLAESGPREVAVRRVPFPKFAFVVIFMAVVLFFMVQSIVTNYEYKRDINKLEEEVEALEKKRDELLSELEQRDDLAYIEDRAEELGMIKDSQSNGKYIDLSNGDFIENFDDDEGTPNALTTLLSAVRKRLSSLVGGGE